MDYRNEHRPLGPLSRRRLLGGTSLAVTASLVGCDLSTEPAGQADENGSDTDALEAPELAEQVESGDLPPLEERLPDEPVIVEPVDRPGVYGGTWNTAIMGTADTAWLGRTIGYECLLRWDPEWNGRIPNVAASIDASADGREFTITLRPGLRWSDGEPFTVDDVIFAYEDVLTNEEVFPVPPSWLMSGGELATLERIDDHQVRLEFARPAGLFLDEMARPGSGNLLVEKPRHYLEQFHAAHNPDADQVAADEGFSDWTELFGNRMSPWENKDLPRLHPWVLTDNLGDGSQLSAVRNPYYWKTDPDGRQLPYIDEVVFDVATDEQVILLKVSNGELDFHSRHINTLSNKPVLASSREVGDYDFVTLQGSFMNQMVISLNLTHEDPVKREVFQNRDFRIGLSHAINRTELNQLIFQDQGQPWQAAPREESEFYDEDFATQYLEFDLDLANEHLDRAGYAERDGGGYRLGPDGQRITFDIEVAPGQVDYWVDAMDLVVANWDEVGIDARVKAEDRSLFQERTVANQHDGGVWLGPGGLGDEIFRAFYYLPIQDSLQAYATLWCRWYKSRGDDSSAEEPPADTKRQFELYWQLQETADEAERADLFRQVIAIAREQFYVLGTVMVPESYGVKRNDFHNVPSVIPESADYNDPAPTNPEQYFIQA